MFLIRQAGPEDFSGVFALAKLLDSYNLPADSKVIRDSLALSEASFAGKAPKRDSRFLFVLEAAPGKIVGCSMIIAKHGRPGRPHLWLKLDRLTRTSRTLKKSRTHSVLKLGFTEDGPTEVGGFVVLPAYRHRMERCGLQLSFIRFLYMAIHPKRFESKVLVEYRGIWNRSHRSPFWESMGRVFTGLSYPKADRLSVTNKEFILSFWPREPIYCALLPPAVQRSIGAIHPEARRAAGLLYSIGFRRLNQIEPFDGGPYYQAKTAQIRVVKQARRRRLLSASLKNPQEAYLIATEQGGWFRGALILGERRGAVLRAPQEVLKLLQINEGDPVYVYRLSR